MGNDSSVLAKHGGGGLIGHGRRMSKAQSSSLLSDINRINSRTKRQQQIQKEEESLNSPAPSIKNQRRTSGAYIKKREQQQRRKAPLTEAASTGRMEKLQTTRRGQQNNRQMEKQESIGSSRGSNDESAGSGDAVGEEQQQESSSPSFVIPEERPSPLSNVRNGIGSNSSNAGSGGGGGLYQQNGTGPGSAKSWLAKHCRKDSAGYSESAILMANGNGLTISQQQQQQKRNRSTSLCAVQMKADCAAIATLSYQHHSAAMNGTGGGGGGGIGLGGGEGGRKASMSMSAVQQQGVMPSMTRLRIQQCYRNAKPIIGHQILKRACTLRSEFKSFLSHLRDDKSEELANDIYKLVTECVANVEMPSKVAATSFAFGEMHAQLCNLGFRPDFFSAIADATIAECVRLDGGAQKRCETLMAWSQLMQFMFSNVRDGYYTEVRQQRRSSLPQQRLLLKQASIAAKHQQQQQNGGTNSNSERESTPTPSMDSCSISSGSRKERRMMPTLQQGISFDMNI